MISEEKRAEKEFDNWAEEGKAEGMAKGHSPVAKIVIDKLSGFENKKVLDLSCGNAWALNYFFEKGISLGIASDISEKMLKKAIRNLAGIKKPWLAVKNSVNFLPFKDESFDIVFNMEAFYYYEKPEIVIREIYRVLKKGGIFLLLVDLFKENRVSMKWLERMDVFMNPMSKDEYKEFLEKNNFVIIDFGQAVSPKIKSREEFKPSESVKTYEEYLELKKAGTLYFIAVK